MLVKGCSAGVASPTGAVGRLSRADALLTVVQSGGARYQQSRQQAARTLLIELAGTVAPSARQRTDRVVQPTLCGRWQALRRVGIVALARRLAIALWRYLQNGEIPTGAALKPATA